MKSKKKKKKKEKEVKMQELGQGIRPAGGEWRVGGQVLTRAPPMPTPEAQAVYMWLFQKWR